MEENLKVDKDYLEAFNLGYELAKELKLNSPMFKNIEPGHSRLNAMQAGMEQYNKEIGIQKNKQNPNDLDNDNIFSKNHKDQDRGKGLDLSV